MSSAGDLLASESLLFAIVGVLLGIWYPEITAALNVKVLPLVVASALIVAVFMPSSVQAIIHAIRALYRHGWSAFSKYDAVQTSLVLVLDFVAVPRSSPAD